MLPGLLVNRKYYHKEHNGHRGFKEFSYLSTSFVNLMYTHTNGVLQAQWAAG